MFRLYFKSGLFISIFLFLFSQAENSFAQNKYWVSFTDKAGVTFNPCEYFSQRTIERRIRYGISLYDSSDFPVNEKYVSQIKSLSDSLGWSSRWLNGVAVYTSEENIKQISKLSFVVDAEELCSVSKPAEEKIETVSKELKPKQLALLKYQTERLQGNLFSKKNIDGKGILIAVFDAGFPEVNHREEFLHLFKENRIKATYDFVTKKENVYAHYPHGTETLSCIAGKYGDINIGLAPGAEFLLARTERAQSEAFSEEENWLAAAEWADKYGADIISSSLGYSNERYFNNEMNGKKSLAARAASMAAAKGILVVNSAGNDGSSSWKFISTPADADSVLAVGGTDPYTDMRIDFSSWGPSSDGRLKPEVCAPAEVMAAGKKGMAHGFGTSFACPLVAGFAACVWQMHHEWNNVELYHKIQEAGHLYPYFDYAHGYGIPQASFFTVQEKKNITPTFHFEVDRFSVKIILSDEYLSALRGLDSVKQHNMYYHIRNADGRLVYYAVLDAKEKEVFSVDVRDYSTEQELVVHFEGYTATYRFIDFKR
jgi:serine protease AprX